MGLGKIPSGDVKSPCTVDLHNAVTVSQQRLGKRAARLSSARMNEVCCSALLSGLQCKLVSRSLQFVRKFLSAALNCPHSFSRLGDINESLSERFARIPAHEISGHKCNSFPEWIGDGSRGPLGHRAEWSKVEG